MGVGRDLHAQRKDGSLLPVEIGLAPFQRNGRKGALATVIDVSDRKDLERRAQVLSNEVRHRARNLLTVVRILARRTLPEQGRARFMGVLDALGRTQDLFAGSTPVPLRSIVEGELTGFLDQVSIEGCDIVLSPRAAQDFTLIAHELTTNAIKYGALSIEGGRVTVSGQDTGSGAYIFTWVEHGGPIVSSPAHRGFGTTILKDAAHAFGPNIELQFRPEGLHYSLEANVEHLANIVDLATPNT